MIPDPRERPTLDAAETAPLYRISTRSAYIEGNRYIESDGAHGIPALRVGRSVRFLTRPILAQLGLLDEEPQARD